MWSPQIGVVELAEFDMGGRTFRALGNSHHVLSDVRLSVAGAYPEKLLDLLVHLEMRLERAARLGILSRQQPYLAVAAVRAARRRIDRKLAAFKR